MRSGFTTDSICMNTMYKHNMCSVTSKPSQSSSRRISSFKDSSALLNNWEMNFTKVKSFWSLDHCLWQSRKYTSERNQNAQNYEKQSSAIKQLLETLLLVEKNPCCFTIDRICRNTMCAVSLANHFRELANAFRPLWTRQCYWITERWTSQNWSPSNL